MEYRLYRIIKNEIEYRLNIEFYRNNLLITILQNLKAWKANVEQGELKILSDRQECNVTDYCNKLRDVIKDSSDSQFKFNSGEFVIHLPEDVKIKYFECKLEEENYNDCIINLMDTFYKEQVQQSKQVQLLETKNEELQKCNKDSLSKLNEYVAQTKNENKDLLNKFILILNEKKRRIQHLTETLEALKNHSPITGNNEGNKRKINMNISDTTSDDEETNQNNVTNAPRNKQIKLSQINQPSTSKSTSLSNKIK